MWWRAVLVLALLLLAGAWDVTYYTRTRLYPPVPRVECFDYPDPQWASTTGAGRMRGAAGLTNLLFDGGSYSSTSLGSRRAFFRRFDSLPFSSSKEDIVKEHAKLVRDINGLKQAPYVQVAPPVDDSRDYDDSIYPEEIDTGLTATTRPVETSVPSSGKRGAPASTLLVPPVAGASQPAVWLAGSPPRARRPYAPTRLGGVSPTVRVCLPTTQTPMPLIYPKPTPNLLQRLLNGIISK